MFLFAEFICGFFAFGGDEIVDVIALDYFLVSSDKFRNAV